MEKSEIERINGWINSKPKWFLYGANILITKDALDRNEINTICDICFDKLDINPQQINVETLLGNSSTKTLTLNSISEINNVNGLAPKNPIVFENQNMTIIYGTNGTGKSSYIRLLKNVCNARQKEEIESNVYTGNLSEQSAKITYKIDENDKCYVWKKGDYSDELQYCDIFDTKYSNLFLKEANTVSYEPPILSFFSKLVDMCERISEEIDLLIKSVPSKLPNFPNTFVSTKAYEWLNKLTYKTTKSEIDSNCIFTDEDSKELLRLQNRLAETKQLEKADFIQKKSGEIKKSNKILRQLL